MAMQNSFFYSSDPLKKAELLFWKENETGSLLLGIRPVSIVGDLEILHDWMNATNRKSNWKLNVKESSLFRHYKKILMSENAQSVMIEQNSTACIQFDIIPVMTGALWSGLSFDQNDYLLYFLFRESFRDPELFVRSLRFLIECLNNLSVIRLLYVKLLEPDKLLDLQLTTTGFEQVYRFSLFGIKEPVYRLLINEYDIAKIP
jgi:hypothetical protein